MVEHKFFKTYEKDNLADGDTYSDVFKADQNYKIHRIHLIRKDGASFTASTFYFKIRGRVHTHEVVPAVVLGPDKEVSPVLDLEFKAGEDLDFAFKNLEGTTVSIFIVFEVHPA